MMTSQALPFIFLSIALLLIFPYLVRYRDIYGMSHLSFVWVVCSVTPMLIGFVSPSVMLTVPMAE